MFQKLLEEMKKNRDEVESCYNNAKAYIDSIKVRVAEQLLPCGGTGVPVGSDPFGLCVLKDYELLVLTYRALQDPTSSPLKKPRMETSSDGVIQEVRGRGLKRGGRRPAEAFGSRTRT